MRFGMTRIALCLIGLLMIGGCFNDGKDTSTSERARDAQQSNQNTLTDVRSASKTVDSMTTENLPQTKPVAQSQLGSAETHVVQTDRFLTGVVASAEKDGKRIQAAESKPDPAVGMLQGWGVIIVVVSVLVFAGSFFIGSMLPGFEKPFRIGALSGVASGIFLIVLAGLIPTFERIVFWSIIASAVAGVGVLLYYLWRHKWSFSALLVPSSVAPSTPQGGATLGTVAIP